MRKVFGVSSATKDYGEKRSRLPIAKCYLLWPNRQLLLIPNASVIQLLTILQYSLFNRFMLFKQ